MEPRINKLLVPVDGQDPARTRAAVVRAIKLCGPQACEVHLLSVQPPVSDHVAGFFPKGELRQIQQRAGAEEMAGARALLQVANVPFTSSVWVGSRAETIAAAARRFGCSTIVMGDAQGAGGFAERVFGSAAQQVQRLLAAGECRVVGP
ncbi:MAG: universal stress protein [Comamonadaceae bacterium]|nr:MAG: universal stress protein [Comamonadaceae bacterium]